MKTFFAARRLYDFLAAITALLAASILASTALQAEVNPAPRESAIVGELRNYEDNLTGTVDALVMLGAAKGLPEGYPNQNAAKTAATTLPGVEAIVKTAGNKYLLFAVRLIENTPENVARISRSEFSALTEADLAVVEYRNLKCRFRHVEMNLERAFNGKPGITNVVDAKGLYVASYKITPTGTGAGKILSMTMDRELGNGNYAEAKEIYLYLQDLNANSQDLDIVKATAQTNLTKLYRSGQPDLQTFAEAEMERRGYSQALITAIKSQK